MNQRAELEVSLQRAYGRPLVERARQLFVRNRVDLEVLERRGAIVAIARIELRGDRSVEAQLVIDAVAQSLISSGCSCHGSPVCEHVIAAILLFEESEGSGASTPVWQRTLDAVLPRNSGSDERRNELGIFVAVIDPTKDRNRYGYRKNNRERYLGVRPAVRGARGQWIKGNRSWNHVDQLSADPHIAELIFELKARYSSAPQYSYYMPDWLELDQCIGRGLWELLTDIHQAGVQFVTDAKRQNRVAFLDETAHNRFAAEEHANRLHVSSEVVAGDQVLDTASAFAVGSPAVAVGYVRYIGTESENIALHKFAAPVSESWWNLARRNKPISIDPADLDRFEQEYLPDLRALGAVESPDGSYTVPPPVLPELQLNVTAVERQVHLTWHWTNNSLFDHDRKQDIVTALRAAVRDQLSLIYPDQADSSVAGSGIVRRVAEAPPDRVLGGTHAVLFVAELLPRLREVDGLTITSGESLPAYRWVNSRPVVSISAEPEGTDWFDLHVEVLVDDEPVEFAQLFLALAAGDPILILPGNQLISLESEEFAQLRAIIEESRTLSEREPGTLRISRYQVDLWDELVESGIVDSQTQEWLSRARVLVDSAALVRVPVPESVHAELRDYQQVGLAWLQFIHTNQLGGILADDMGLGKTLQAIAMMAAAREADPNMPPFLVIAPTSVVGNWIRECRRFAPELKVVAINSTIKRREIPLADITDQVDVVVTSYTLMRLEEDDYRDCRWSGIVFDEAQQIKNHRSKGYVAARRIESPCKIAITGTPLENNLTELWALASLTCPGLLGSESFFTDFYRAPIEKAGDADRLARLQRRLRPFMLRRRKSEVAAELPAKQEVTRELTLHPSHRRLYDLRLQKERQKVLGLLDDVAANRFEVFRSLSLLRQLAIDAELVDHEGSRVPPSVKADTLVEILTEACSEGHRVLIFSQFTRFLSKAHQMAQAAGVSCGYLDGKTSARKREQTIDKFRSGEFAAFFISLKAGGFGLNLTEADHVILLDPWWNPAVETQAIDRTHRIGQTRTVLVHRLVAAETIEQKVLTLSERKARLFADVIDGDGRGASGILTADEIRELVS